jgi:hypothetical protein
MAGLVIKYRAPVFHDEFLIKLIGIHKRIELDDVAFEPFKIFIRKQFRIIMLYHGGARAGGHHDVIAGRIFINFDEFAGERLRMLAVAHIIAGLAAAELLFIDGKIDIAFFEYIDY